MYDPLILSYEDHHPKLGAGLLSGARVALIGRLVLGTEALLGEAAVIRADGHDITIGCGFALGARGTVHIAHAVLSTEIGDHVTAGEGAVLHACRIGNHCVIGAGSVILDGSVLGDGALLEPDSIVFPNTTLVAGWRYGGRPARQIARITPQALAQEGDAIRGKLMANITKRQDREMPYHGREANFLASTARVTGRLEMASDASVFFSCALDAGANTISIGRGSNVQDNSILTAHAAPLVIGEGATIGHNVELHSCTIGDHSLIGMGAILAEGTIVEAGTLVAAGARSTAGMRLGAGQVWAGDPARPIGPMQPHHYEMIQTTVPHYIAYATAFRRTEGERNGSSPVKDHHAHGR